MASETWASRRLLGGIVVCAAALGCTNQVQEDASVDRAAPLLVPVSGTVIYNGAPLEAAVVALLPDTGPNAVGETDKNGAYKLECFGQPGAPPGNYKVAVSYLLSAEGVAQGLGPRSAIIQSAGMLSSKEMMPAEYADFGRSVLSTVIPKAGKSDLDFDLKGPELTRSKPAADQSAPTESQPAPAPDSPPAP